VKLFLKEPTSFSEDQISIVESHRCEDWQPILEGAIKAFLVIFSAERPGILGAEFGAIYNSRVIKY
jgi:hypothetical protein